MFLEARTVGCEILPSAFLFSQHGYRVSPLARVIVIQPSNMFLKKSSLCGRIIPPYVPFV